MHKEYVVSTRWWPVANTPGYLCLFHIVSVKWKYSSSFSSLINLWSLKYDCHWRWLRVFLRSFWRSFVECGYTFRLILSYSFDIQIYHLITFLSLKNIYIWASWIQSEKKIIDAHKKKGRGRNWAFLNERCVNNNIIIRSFLTHSG